MIEINILLKCIYYFLKMIKDFSIKPVIFGNDTREIANRRNKSPQVTPQRESNLCRASYGDFSCLEMIN